MVNFEEFAKDFLKQRSRGYYEKFWAGTAMANGLTVKTPDGKEIMVKPSDIYMTDLGDMSGNCMCGHAIRYEYYLGEIGPIGSKCIQTMTGLEGEDLRKILRGAEFARKDRDELIKVKEQYGTFVHQLEADHYLKDVFGIVTYDEMPEDIKKFIDNDVPMPNSVIRKMRNIACASNVETIAVNKYGPVAKVFVKEYEEIYQNIEQVIKNCDLPEEYQFYGENKYCHETMKEIAEKMKTGKATDKAAMLFFKLHGNLKNQKFIDALYVLIKLTHHLDKMEEFWENVVKDNLTNALKWGLTVKQCEFILNKSSSGKDGLALKFKDLLEKDITKQEETVEDKLQEIANKNDEKFMELEKIDDEAEGNPFG